MVLIVWEPGVKVCPATSLASWATLGRSLNYLSTDIFTCKIKIVSPALPTTRRCYEDQIIRVNVGGSPSFNYGASDKCSCSMLPPAFIHSWLTVSKKWHIFRSQLMTHYFLAVSFWASHTRSFGFLINKIRVTLSAFTYLHLYLFTPHLDPVLLRGLKLR